MTLEEKLARLDEVYCIWVDSESADGEVMFVNELIDEAGYVKATSQEEAADVLLRGIEGDRYGGDKVVDVPTGERNAKESKEKSRGLYV